ncbi:MAG: AsmA-like C-terminal domain-containing protein [Planctomycetaceae bacterium]|nr:AsmA-like C-terminal domain-containing protein [Planctomycetaceae bacterium]
MVKSSFKTAGRFLKWGILLTVITAACFAVYLYQNLDTQLKQYILGKLSQQYPHLEITIESVQLIPSKGIMLRGVQFAQPVENNSSRQLLDAQEIFIACPVELKTVLQGNLHPTKIVISKANLNVALDENGQLWGPKLLKPARKSDSQPCPLEILESGVTFRDWRKPDAAPLQFNGFHLTAIPPQTSADSSDTDSNDVDSSNITVTQAAIPEKSRPLAEHSHWLIDGEAANNRVETFKFQVAFDPDHERFQVQGNAGKLVLNHEYFSYLPAFGLANQALESFQAKADFHFELTHDAEQFAGLPFATTFQVAGKLYEGRILSPIVAKYPISDIEMQFEVTPDSLHVSNMSAISGESSLVMDWRQQGLCPIKNAKFGFQVKNLRFDKPFLQSLSPFLPQRLNDQLEDYETSGMASIVGSVFYDGKRWGIARCEFLLSEMSVSYERFPYMLDRLSGNILIEPKNILQTGGQFTQQAAPQETVLQETTPQETLSLSLKTSDGKRTVSIGGELLQIMSNPHGKFEIVGENIPFDDKLLSAIKNPKHRAVIESLHVSGNFNASMVIVLPGNHQPAQSSLELAPLECTLKYEKFPMTIRRIRGFVRMQNNQWSFDNLRAENGTTVLLGDGHLFSNEDGNEFRLHTVVKSLALNEELYAAFINEGQQNLIKSLNIQGAADVNLDINYHSAGDQLNIGFDAVPDPLQTRLRPVAFPILLDTVTCRVHYRNGSVEVRDFRGKNGDTALSANMNCDFQPDGSWVMSLDQLLAERVEHSLEFERAIPGEMQTLLDQLAIREPVTLRGDFCFEKGASADSKLRSYWNVGVICHQNSANIGVPVTNICGKINLLGKNDGVQSTVFGELEIDSAMYLDYQLTNIRGPFSFYDNKVTLGANALAPVLTTPPSFRQTSLQETSPLPNAASDERTSLQPGQPPLRDRRPQLMSLTCSPDNYAGRPIDISVYGGHAQVGGVVFPNASYRLSTSVHEIDLATASRETLMTGKLKGKMSGKLELTGGRSGETREGNGHVAIRDADIYQLPTLQRLMKYFRIRDPGNDRSAICSGDIDFLVRGNNVNLSDVQLEGNLLSLSGNGAMNIDTMTVNLSLGTRLGNRQSQIPFVSDLVNATSDQISQIQVDGRLGGDISIRPQALPNVQQAIKSSQENPNKNRPVRDFFRNTFAPGN